MNFGHKLKSTDKGRLSYDRETSGKDLKVKKTMNFKGHTISR